MKKNPLDLLPDFENLTYSHIKQPVGAKLIAWKKAEEAERRTVFYEFVEVNLDLSHPKRRLLDDMLAAFLLTFEAAVQHAKDQAKGSPAITPDFEKWLNRQPEHDTLFRGLRSLRHLQAHVEAYGVAQNRIVVLQNLPDSSTRWSLQRLSTADLGRLKHGPLTPSDLPDWQNLVDTSNTKGLMIGGLNRLSTIFNRLETLI